MRFLTALLLSWFVTEPCLAWFEGGHHLIAVMAYDELSEAEQHEIQTILAAHPRFAEDFRTPADVVGQDEINDWIIGRAAYWPDVARALPVWTRPSWHYQLGASLTIGNVNPPKNPGPLPDSATLETQELHIAQAVELCRKVLRDKLRSNSDRALAICWLSHLVGDAHQPCHAGSLYAEGVFPEGDRGANSILTKQAKTLHLVWDGLLGPKFDAGDIRRRSREIKSDDSVWSKATDASRKPSGLDPLTWLSESAEYGRSHVYGPEVLSAVAAAARGSQPVETLDLSEEYLRAAGELARVRAAFAAQRLAGILREGL